MLAYILALDHKVNNVILRKILKVLVNTKTSLRFERRRYRRQQSYSLLTVKGIKMQQDMVLVSTVSLCILQVSLFSLMKGSLSGRRRHIKRRKTDIGLNRASDTDHGSFQYVDIDEENNTESQDYITVGSGSQKNEPPTISFSAESFQERSRLLHERINKNTNDVNAWLELVHLQWSFIGADTGTLDSSRETTLAHMEMAVLDRALNANPSNRLSLPLVLEHIKVASNSGLWDVQKVNERWHEVLTWTTHSLESLVTVWYAFLDYRKSTSSQFRVDDTLKLYSDALHAINTAAKKSESQLLDIYRLDLIKSLSQLLQCAGYTEWGTAILQAEIEILVCAVREGIPSTLEYDDFLDLFSVWWDDDQCHISDQGDYRGFSHLNWKRPVSHLDQKWEEYESSSKLDPDGSFQVWRHNELVHGKRLQPRNIGSKEGHPDPYSFVLAADIRDLLFIPASYPHPILVRALDIFTEYLGMPQNWIWQTLNFGSPALSENCIEYMYSTASCFGQIRFPEDFWLSFSSLNPFNEKFIMKMPCSIDVLFPRLPQDPRGEWFTILPNPNKYVCARVERCLLQVMNQQNPLKSCVDDFASMDLALPLAVLYAAGGNPKRYVCILTLTQCTKRIKKTTTTHTKCTTIVACIYPIGALYMGKW